MKMKDLCPEDRPREKMLLRGAGYLTNTELLAILIGSGTEDKNATQIAQELLASADGSLLMLSAMPLARLIAQKGIGKVRAITIAAALELGKRSSEEKALTERQAITSSNLVYQLMLPSLRNLDHEECWVIYLNRKNFLLGKEMICSGSLETTLVDSRRIVRYAIEKQALGIILVHNHPGGSPTPSASDIEQTDLLKKALSAVEISLIDHVIIAGEHFFSFADERIY